MKKTVVSLTLLLSLLTTVGCSNSATAKKTDKDGTKVDVMYTYGENEDEKTEVTADDVYGELVHSTTGSKALFDAVYKKVIEEEIEEMMRLANEVKVSSSFAPSATFIISSFKLTEGLRSKVRVSDFLDFVTPTASTITKWSLFSVAEGETFCRSSLSRVRVPRPFICSK